MLRLALAQLDLTVGALAENRKRIADACSEAARAGAELVLAPELAISGYPPEDLLLRPAFLRACKAEAERLAAEVEVPLVVGCPWLDGDRVRNAALVIAGGEILARYDKRELPNYGVFDEERTFSPGRGSLHIETPGGALALTICEDVWLPDAVAEAAALGASCVLNISASPYHLGKGQSREEMLATRARDGLCAVAYCNLVGGQDELVFDGRSAVFGPDGTVLARAASFAEELLICDLDLDASLGERLRDSRLRRGRRHRVHPPVTVELRARRRPLARSRRRSRRAPAGTTAELWGALRLGLADYVRKNGFERVRARPLGRHRLGARRRARRRRARRRAGRGRLDADALQQRGHAQRRAPRRRAARHRLPRARDRGSAARLRGRAARHERPGRREPAGAHPRRAADDALEPARLARAHDRQQVRDGGRLLDALRRHRPAASRPSRTSRRRSSSRSRATSTSGPGSELIPVSIIERPPSAELRDEQRDDQSLPPYDELDPLLEAYVEDDLSPEEIARRGIATLEVAQRIARLVDLAEYKRRQAPPGIRVHNKAFGRDRRLPITNRFGR